MCCDRLWLAIDLRHTHRDGVGGVKAPIEAGARPAWYRVRSWLPDWIATCVARQPTRTNLARGHRRRRPPVREIAGLQLDAFRREVYRDGRYVALTRKQFAVLDPRRC